MFSGFMINAWETASIVAVVAGVVGFFVVLRGSAFAAHAIPNGAFAGAAGANLLGFSTIAGLGAFSLLAAIAIAALGRRARRDVATALVLVLALALGAAFLSQSTQYEAAIFSLLFGEILGVNSGEILPVALLAIGCVLVVALFYRKLWLTSVVPEIAAARGVSNARVELAFLLVVAAATTMTVPVVGTLLIFTLMIGPPATARTLCTRPAAALVASVAVALATVWTAVASSFLTNWPVGFFVGALSAGGYATARLFVATRSRSSRSV